MHICIIGDGVAGLMAANFFACREYITKITHIGSSKIPSIGVGESTTLNFEGLHSAFDDDFESFVKESDACVKVGVLYSDWSKREFLHHFKNPRVYQNIHNIDSLDYSNSLGNKDKNTYIHDLIGNKLYHDAKNNQIPKNKLETFYLTSWHFDAGKYISYLKKLLNGEKEKIEIIDDTVIDCKFKQDGVIDSIKLESSKIIKADYYIIATGKSNQSSNIFKLDYNDLSDVLLTDKALFYPKDYTDKVKEIHPYTVAKTMKNGWRWITPTWSRIGTGYVFSSKYVSVDEAIREFQEDIQDDTVIPNVVDFHPRYCKKTFNKNYMTLGMCNGFLEPLDAPGLSISCALTMALDSLFNNDQYLFNILHEKYDDCNNEPLNQFTHEMYKGLAAFILTQYKTCHRIDTQFWIDHKNVEFEYLSSLMEDLNNVVPKSRMCSADDSDAIIRTVKRDVTMMIQQTIASKNIQWKTKTDLIPFKLNDSDYESIDHYEILKMIRRES